MMGSIRTVHEELVAMVRMHATFEITSPSLIAENAIRRALENPPPGTPLLRTNVSIGKNVADHTLQLQNGRVLIGLGPILTELRKAATDAARAGSEY